MATWTNKELDLIGNAEEVQIATVRRNGTLSRPITIWDVRDGDDIYVRAVNGRNATWFQHALATHEGQIRAGNIAQDVAFVETNSLTNEIDAAYRAKYSSKYPSIVPRIVRPEAEAATFKLVPR